MIEIKPQDWHNVRMIDSIPDHFTKIRLSTSIDRVELLRWIDKNTTGRFAIVAIVERLSGIVGSFGLHEEMCIGFENYNDATIYTLSFK